MPFPILIAWALGAMATGAAAGKGAQMYGNAKLEEAEKLKEETETYLRKRSWEYLRTHRRYIERLTTHVAVLRAAIRDVPGVSIVNELPPEIQGFLDKVYAPWGGSSTSKNSNEIFYFTASENHNIRNTFLGTRALTGGNAAMGGAAASVLMAFNYAQKGISYALDANKNFDELKSWAHNETISIDAQIEELNADIENVESTFDKVITPRLQRAISSIPADKIVLGQLLGMAEAIERSALKNLSDLAKSMDNLTNE